jgi:peptidoglycan/LPS O-acetylase OafA/YrhL
VSVQLNHLSPSTLLPVPALNGVRGLAFLAVLLSHTNDFTQRPLFWADGQVGVWLFFVLSSFLLARQFFANPSVLLTLSGWRHYLVRRFLRIYPLFIVYVLCLGWLAHVPSGKCLRVLALETTHAVDWSLYLECRFYLLLPLLVVPLALGLRARIYMVSMCSLLLGLIICFPFWRSYQTWPWADAAAQSWAGNALLLQWLNCFLAGVIAAYFAVNHRPYLKVNAHWVDAVSALSLLAMIALPFGWQNGLFGKEITYEGLSHLWFPYSCLFALWLYLLSVSSGIFARIMASRPCQFLGAISYPGYLFHIFIMHSLRPISPANDVVFAALSLAVVLIVSWVLHRCIELPVMNRYHSTTRQCADAQDTTGKSKACLTRK